MNFLRRPDVSTQELQALYEEGLTLKAVGLRFGMNPVSVWQRLKAAGIPTRQHKTRLTLELLEPLVNSGISTQAIAEAVGVSPSMITRRLRALSLRAVDGRARPRRIYRHREIAYFSGYRMVYLPGHPHADKKGRVMEHRLVMEQTLGRYLMAEEIVHHMNHVRDDNRAENLLLLPDRAAHGRLHQPVAASSSPSNAARWRRHRAARI